ncbi:MAG: efflux RND transporter periplasmic adaptor subunit [Shimia sp.]
MAEAAQDDSGSRPWVWFLLGLIVLAAGSAGYWGLSQPADVEPAPPPPPPLIETARATAVEEIVLRQTAFVRPVAELPVLPELQARIASVNPAFDRGRFVDQGQVLVTLDSTDTDARIAQADARLAEAEAAVTEARIEADRQRELEERGVVAESVLQQALVGLASAEAALETAQAERRLAAEGQGDTRITAPFDAIVQSVAADPGELATPGTPLGRLVAADAAELEMGLLPGDLALLPDGAMALEGATVRVRQDIGTPVLAEGVVTAVESGLSEGSRLLPLVVRIPEPFAGDRPLRLDELLLAELPVAIGGEGALAVPARALKPGGVIWAVRDGALVRLMPEVLRREDTADGERAILRAGALRAGDTIMLTDLAAPTEGQQVRTGDTDGGTP